MSTATFPFRRPAATADEIAGRTPPHNVEAEAGLIGGILLENDFIPEVMNILRGPEDFYRSRHEILYKGILELHASGQAVDALTLAEWLERKGYWNEIGEEETLRGIIESTPNVANTLYYAQIVHQRAMSREVIETANRVLNDAYSNQFTSDQLVDTFRAGAEKLETVSTGWAEPNLDGMPAAAPFPLDALPDALKQFAVAAAASFPCPPDFVAVSCLAIAAGAIGRSVALGIKDTWAESPSLYVAFCSPPGSTKSAAIKVAMQPLMRIQEKELLLHQVGIAAAKAAKRAEDEARKNAGKNALPESELVLPRLKRTLVGDTTVEKLAVILSENPRGVTMVHDELTAWLDGMGQYKQGGGNDRQFFLSAWSGAAVSIDRKNQENGIPLFLSHPTLSIVGAMTPDMLRPCLDNGGKEDGFTDRILVSYPDPVEIRYTDETIPADLIESWASAMEHLWRRPLVVDGDGDDRPHFVRFTEWGQQGFRHWFDSHSRESEQDDFPRHLRGPWAKMRGYCARLALVIECLNAAFDPTAPDHPRSVSLESLNSAIKILDYFKAHARRVHFLIHGSDSDNPDARAVLKWASLRPSNRFTAKEARDCFRRRFAARPEQLDEAIAWLVCRNCIRKLATVAPSRGRRPSDSFEVHSQISESARVMRDKNNPLA